MGTELNLIITFRSYFDFLLFYLHFHVLYNYKFFPLVKRGGGGGKPPKKQFLTGAALLVSAGHPTIKYIYFIQADFN